MVLKGTNIMAGLSKRSIPGLGSIRKYVAPGIGYSRRKYEMLRFGEYMREHVHDYPILGGALKVFNELACNREFRVSGTPRGAPKALEFLNNAITRCYDGSIDYGFSQYQNRRATDYNIVGRTAFTWRDGFLEYLDPCHLSFDLKKQLYTDTRTNQKYRARDQITINSPMPVGREGDFISPIYNVIPSAILQWLVREHDTAAADGRKVKDILVTLTEDLATQALDAIEDNLKMWSGAEVNNNILVIHHENDQSDLTASDLFSSIGLSSVPEGFDRAGSLFAYVNEIGNATGLTTRQFWTDARGTNRALEQVQQERQTVKGPGVYVRSEERLINGSGCLKQFGASTRMGFIEEIDAASREVNAKVIKLYSDALASFAKILGGEVNGEGFIAWLKDSNIFPPNIDLILNVGTLVASDGTDAPVEGTVLAESGDSPSSGVERSRTILDYGEITIDQHGYVIDRRNRSFHIQSEMPKKKRKLPTFDEALLSGQKRNAEAFFENYKTLEDERVQEIAAVKFEDMTDRDHRLVYDILKSAGKLPND